jgi:mono/diheme cytochrome c family protein
MPWCRAASRSPVSPRNRFHALVNHSDPAIYRRAQELFNVTTNSEREQIIQKLMPATRMQGDPAAGRKTYTERCAACHRFQNEGNAVGPDIVAMKTSGQRRSCW